MTSVPRMLPCPAQTEEWPRGILTDFSARLSNDKDKTTVVRRPRMFWLLGRRERTERRATHISEDDNLVGLQGGGGKLFHRAAPSALYDLVGRDTARVHAGAAKQHLTLAGGHPVQHPFDVVVTFRRLLAFFRAKHGISQQEHNDGRILLR